MHQDVVCDPVHSDVPAGGRFVLDRVLAQT